LENQGGNTLSANGKLPDFAPISGFSRPVEGLLLGYETVSSHFRRDPNLPPPPFSSRRIGLSDAGEPIDILGGAKITGLWNVVTQFDNVSDEFGLNSRLRWTITRGATSISY
jgi:hypothetical protein